MSMFSLFFFVQQASMSDAASSALALWFHKDNTLLDQAKFHTYTKNGSYINLGASLTLRGQAKLKI